MQIFKAFFKIAGKKKFSAIIYIVIFLFISIVISKLPPSNETYNDTILSIGIIDEDNTDYSSSLKDFIGEHHNITDFVDDKDKILNSLFYQNVDYVLTIKEGYADKISSGNFEGLFTNYQAPNQYSGELFESQLDQYITNLAAYEAGGFTIDEALEKATISGDELVNVETSSTSNKSNLSSNNIYYYFQYLPYIFIAILISSLCPTLLQINQKEIRRRTNCSCISTTKQTFIIALAAFIYTLIIWLVFVVAAFFMCKKDLLCYEGFLSILNILIFALVALAISMLISSLTHSGKATDMIANVVGLGMSFLCGIFVPLELLDESVIKVAHFLPAYWYVKANDMLNGISNEVFTNAKYFSYLGIELLFAVAIFAVIVLIAKIKNKSSSN